SEPRISLDAWVAASVQSPMLRDHVKMRLLRPRRGGAAFDATDDSADGLLDGLLLGVTRRHAKLMTSRLRLWTAPAVAAAAAAGSGGGGSSSSAAAGGGGGAAAADASVVAELLSAVDKAAVGGDKFRAYVQMLLAIIKRQVAGAIAALTGDDGCPNDWAVGQVEDALSRLEDCALIMLNQASYLLQCGSLELQMERVRRLPPAARTAYLGRQLALRRQHSATARHMAAIVVQSAWRRHRRAT
ncbi:hypothetical protein Agub_g12552, partial [Astrephomene gubernaculifera]